MKEHRLPLIISLIFFILLITPIFYLGIGIEMFISEGKSPFEVILSDRTFSLFGNTIIYAVGGALISTSMAFIYAWIIIRTDVPGRKLLELLPVMALTMPLLVKAFAWIILFSPRRGIFNELLVSLGIPKVFNIFSMEGMIFALGVGGVPLAYLVISPAIKSMDPSLEEASRIIGHSIPKTLFKTTIPILLPAILSAFLLLTIIGLENFDYPFMLGNPGGVDTLATEVYYWAFEHIPPRYDNSALISLIYIVLTFIAVTIYIYVTRKAFKFMVVTGKVSQRTIHELRNWKWLAFGICFFILLLSFLLPFSVLFLLSFTKYGNVYSLTLENYVDALNLPLFWDATRNAISMAALSGFLGTLIATIMAYAALKSKVRGSRIIEYISSIPLAFPGIVYGLALYWTFLMLPGVSDVIYGTIWPLVIALMVIRLPHSFRMVSSNLIQISDELEEASSITGAKLKYTLRRVVLPLLRGGLINSFLYTFINSIRELGAVVLLVTPGSMVLMVLLLNLYSQHATALNTIAAASVIITGMIAAFLVIFNLIGRYFGGSLHEG